MKKMLVSSLQGILLGLFLLSSVFGQTLIYEDYATVTASNLNQTKITLDVPEIPFSEIEKDGKKFIRFEEKDFPLTCEIGKPELPFFSTFVAIPAQAGVSLQVVPKFTEILKNVIIFPSQNNEANENEDNEANPRTNAFDFDTKFYSSNEIFPRETGNVSEPVILRELRLVSLKVYPFRYNPESKELEIAKEIEITLNYDSVNLTNSLSTEPSVVGKSFDELYKSTVINYNTLGVTTAPISYYLIYAPQASMSIAQQLADWKNQKGVKTTVINLDQFATESALKSDILNHFNSPTSVEFVLFIGDEGVNQSVYMTNGYSDENHFATLVGTDYFPDIFFGRIPRNSANTTNLQKIQTSVTKTIIYEKTPFISPTVDWYKKGLVAANDAYVSQKDTKNKVRTKLLDNFAFTSVDTFFVENGAQKTQFINSWNAGKGYVNYRGEGWVTGWNAMGFGVSDANTLTLSNMAPVVTSIGCGVSLYSGSNDCLGEALLFRGSGNSVGGATSFVGPTGNTHTSWNNKIDLGLYNALTKYGHQHIASALTYGKMYMFSVLGEGSTTEQEFEKFLVFGDAEFNVRTTTPKPMTLQAPSAVIPNSVANVIVTETGTGKPIGGAQVCAYTTDGSVYFVGETDIVGQLPIQIGNTTIGSSLFITVAGKDVIPQQQSYTITNQQQFVTYNQILINDATGNNDGLITPGETVNVGLVLHNYGSQTASNVVASISVNDPLVTVLQNQISYGNIASNGVVQPPSNFQLQVAPTYVDFHAINVTLTMTASGGNSWTEHVNIPIATPVLAYEDVVTIDYGSTFHPNHLDPGETAIVKVILKNNGWGKAENLSAILVCSNPQISITDANATYTSAILPDSLGGYDLTDAFEVFVPANFPKGPIEFELYATVTSPYNHTFSIPFLIPIGELFPEDPSEVDSHGYRMIENADTNILEAPVYNWKEIAPPANGVGTQVPFSGSVSDQTVITFLPFTFKFYGQDFGYISINTDGFVMLGSNNGVQWKNQDLPCQDNLSNMVCAFWTDLWDNQNGENGHIYKYHDTTNHRFIVEWY
ncbi:hypothetical protein IT568_11695, partial [bacterium]|nr:hypothetical protein [bacterium]